MSNSDSTLDGVIDVLHAAGHFAPEIAAAPDHATVKAGDMGAGTFWWASCLTCWWWNEDDPGDPGFRGTPEAAQLLADAHNAKHHPVAP